MYKRVIVIRAGLDLSRWALADLVARVVRGIELEFCDPDNNPAWDGWEDIWVEEERENLVFVTATREQMVALKNASEFNRLPHHEEGDAEALALGPWHYDRFEDLGVNELPLFQ